MHIHFSKFKSSRKLFIEHRYYCDSKLTLPDNNNADMKNDTYAQKWLLIKNKTKDGISNLHQTIKNVDVNTNIKNVQNICSSKMKSTNDKFHSVKDNYSSTLNEVQKTVQDSVTGIVKLDIIDSTIVDDIKNKVSLPIDRVNKQIKYVKITMIIVFIVICIFGTIWSLDKITDILLKFKQISE